MSDDLVKRLQSPANVFYEYAADEGAMLREAAARITALEAENKRLREALEPLREWAVTKMAGRAEWTDELETGIIVTVGELRRAAAASEKK